MLIDASTESVHSLLAILMAVVLRSSVVAIVEGIAQATAAKVSDRIQTTRCCRSVV